MTDKIEVKKGDKGFNLNFVVKDSDGNVRDLTDYTVTLKVWRSGRPDTLIINAECTIDVAASGTCHYTVAADVLVSRAEYEYELELTATGVVDSSESGVFEIKESG